MQPFWSWVRMRRHSLVVSLMFSLFAFSAHGETIQVGGTPVDYAIPEGYVLAEGLAYEPFYNLMREALSDFTLHGVYVPESVDQEMKASGSEILTQYLVVMHMKRFEKDNFSKKDIEDIKQVYRENPAFNVDGMVEERMKDAFEKQGVDANFSSLTVPLGLVEDGENHLSILLFLKQRAENEKGGVDNTQAVLTRFILSNGKMLQVSVHKVVETEAEARLFQTEALGVLDGMNFSEKAAWRLPPAVLKVGFYILIVWGVAAIVTVVVLRVRRSRKG